MIHTTTNPGLHEFVIERVLANLVHPGMRVADLGSGPGGMAARLKNMGCEVIAADRSAHDYEAGLPHVEIDFNQLDFAASLGHHAFGIVTAIEVIEHVECPISFLRNVASLLALGGVAVITTPNLDSVPARLKFLVAGKIRTMDEYGEPTHISPIFFDLLKRQFLPIAGLRLRRHLLFPPDRFQLSRKSVAWCMRLVATVFPGESSMGDNHVLVLEAAR